MSKPANDNLPPLQELPATGTEIQRKQSPPDPHSARPRSSGICELLLAQNSCAASQNP